MELRRSILDNSWLSLVKLLHIGKIFFSFFAFMAKPAVADLFISMFFLSFLTLLIFCLLARYFGLNFTHFSLIEIELFVCFLLFP